MIKITSTQIPRFWEVIKYCALNSAQIHSKYQTTYCINLLIDLLSGKKECFIVKEDSRISVVVILSFYNDKYINVTGISIDNIYSFTKNARRFFQEIERDIVKLAEVTNSKFVIIETANKAIVESLHNLQSFSKAECGSKFIYYL